MGSTNVTLLLLCASPTALVSGICERQELLQEEGVQQLKDLQLAKAQQPGGRAIIYSQILCALKSMGNLAINFNGSRTDLSNLLNSVPFSIPSVGMELPDPGINPMLLKSKERLSLTSMRTESGPLFLIALDQMCLIIA